MKSTSQTVSTSRKSRITTRSLVVTAMLSAVAFVLMFIEMPIPMLIPSFVKLDISDLPALLGSFALGPVYGIVIELLKNLLHILIKGTSSAYVGELFNFVMGGVFAGSAGLIYHLRRTRRGAVVASLVGCALMAVLSVPFNYFLVYPAYVVCYGMPMEAIVGMYQAILPSSDSLLKCLVIFNLPFTFCKGLICSIICFFIYKPLSPLMRGKQ